ncbi:MAG: tol-pal system protein YbgF [Alphaproteobacteria bacterium]|nr:tol-pal system protein YbgF [Alphaproteobacteria bacterium]
MKRSNIPGLKIAAGVAAVAVMMVPGWSYGQPNDQTIATRLRIIEKQLQAVQRKVFTPGSQFPNRQPRTGTVPGPTGEDVRLADMEARFARMQTQIRQLTGRVEESNFQVSRLKQQLKTLSSDYEFRLEALEKSSSPQTVKPGQSQKMAAPNKAKTADILPKGTEKQQYSYAQKLVIKGQYAEAKAALGAFLKRYPKARLAGNAQYWLGQTYYVRKMYTKAARAFLEGYNTYPESPKAPAFLLKIGMSLYAMGEKNDACDAYRELASRFPDSVESKNKRPPEQKRAGCK